MTNGSDPVNAGSIDLKGLKLRGISDRRLEEISAGLTKREFFAAMAMQGILAHHGVPDWVTISDVKGSIALAAKVAVASSDAIIKALNEKEEK